MAPDLLLQTDLPGMDLLHRGKVRDLYALDGELLIVTTDRVSAFDVVLPGGIPHKGEVLNRLSLFWFARLSHIVPNHVLATDPDALGRDLGPWTDRIRGRMILARRVSPFPFEFVVRGYLMGSAFESYLRSGSVSGVSLPLGLEKGSKLPGPMLTPTTKSHDGYDLPVTAAEVAEAIGPERSEWIQGKALSLFEAASSRARESGLLLADTKMEFGHVGDEILLIDELFTPDSSRFLLEAEYVPGHDLPSYDKQIVRDHLIQIGWNRRPPAPALPADVVEKTSARYVEVFERLTGERFHPMAGCG